jgi:hypothetical protein
MNRQKLKQPHGNRIYLENFALLGHYTVSNANPLQTCWDNISVPSSRVKKTKKKRNGKERWD